MAPREKNLLPLFLGLNVALAACFVGYVILSSSRQPKVTPTPFKPIAGVTSSVPSGLVTGSVSVAASGSIVTTNPAAAAGAETNGAASVPRDGVAGDTNAVAASVAGGGTNDLSGRPVASTKKVGWEQLDTPDYDAYLRSLRAVGCPDEKVRYIVMADINDLVSKKRVKEAVAHDIQWWRAEPEQSLTMALQEKGRTLEEEKNRLILKYLGPAAVEDERGEAMLWSNVQLTGPVLGSLPTEIHNQVQEICGRSIERSQASFWARVNDGQPLNPVDMAKMREQTRADLRKILKPDQLEEFLLRYSHNAHQLRLTLRGFDPTPEEFRRIFRVTDAMDHQLQLEYGGAEALSQEQRERHERQREAGIREAIGAKRYQEYQMTKDPIYRQAQMTALQYGAPSKAIQPIYQMTKEIEARRQKVLNDATLTAQQKSQALQAIQQDQIRSIQKIVTDAAALR